MMKNKYTECLGFLKELSISRENLFIEEIEEIEELLSNDNFKIAVIGEFSVGKSTFLNSIIGKRILYSSAQEATGIVTSIVNSNKRCADIIYDNDEIKTIDISGDDAYRELKNYLDKNTTATNIRAININYPIDGINKDVILLDTPGLQGIGKKELLITREALKSANATIVVINNKGISATELQLLLGKLKEFGRIKTKEIVLVINKTGELYKNRNEEQAQAKINEVINDVKMTLNENNLENIKVFAIDSRDYLWAKDTNLYNQVLEKNKSNITEILSQEYYLGRSNFNEFKNYLHNFLSVDSRTKAFYEDINEKLMILLDEFIIQFQASDNNEYRQIEEVLNRISNQKELILENRRNMKNSTIRQLQKSITDFKELLKEDIDIELKKSQKELLNYIDEEIDDVNKLNNHTKELLFKKIEKIVKERSNIYVKNIYEYQGGISKLLKNNFNKVFNKIFNKNSKITFNISKQEVNVDLKFSVNIDNSQLKELNNIVEHKEKELKQKQNEAKNNNVNYNQEIRKIEAKIKLELSNRDFEIKEKGPKPEPKQKYRTVTRTKRKWLIFKEEYTKEVPDGIDYSDVEAWEKSCKSIRQKYRSIQEKLDSNIDKLRLEKINLEKLLYDIENLKLEIEDLKLTIHRAKEKEKDLIEKRRQHFLDKKKNELYIEFSDLLKRNFNKLKVDLNEQLDNTNEKIGKDVQEQIEKYIVDINRSLDKKYAQVRSKIENLVSINDNSLEEIQSMKKLIAMGE